MIVLDVKDYCHSCSNFEPQTTIFYRDIEPNIVRVYCLNKDICNNVYQYAKDEMEEEKLDA